MKRDPISLPRDGIIVVDTLDQSALTQWKRER